VKARHRGAYPTVTETVGRFIKEIGLKDKSIYVPEVDESRVD